MNLNTALNSLFSLDPEAAYLLQQAISIKQSPDAKVQVAAIGLYNAGKSTLLNALADCVETECFRTSPVRETRVRQTRQLEKYILIDTPGIDADENDDNTAFKDILSSDLLLMAHNLTLGDLDAPTLDYLLKVRQQSQQPLHERLICVLTHAEGQREAYSGVVETVLDQLDQACSGTPPYFLVASRSYLKGQAQGKLRLVEASGIPMLRYSIEQRVEELHQQLNEIREQKHQQLLDQVQELVLATMRDRELSRKKIVGKLYQQLNTSSREVSQIKQRMRAALEA